MCRSQEKEPSTHDVTIGRRVWLPSFIRPNRVAHQTSKVQTIRVFIKPRYWFHDGIKKRRNLPVAASKMCFTVRWVASIWVTNQPRSPIRPVFADRWQRCS